MDYDYRIYYYYYFDIPFGSMNETKITHLSKRDSDGVIYWINTDDPSEFQGVLLDDEWIG